MTAQINAGNAPPPPQGGRLWIKLLIPMTAILAVSLFGLSLIIITSQENALNQMGHKIHDMLTESGEMIDRDLQGMESDVTQKMGTMAQTTTSSLTASCSKALTRIQTDIEEALVDNVHENAAALAALLANVAPAAILSNDYTSLLGYVKSACSNPSVVYALFLKPTGKPYIKYIDRKHPKIKHYLKTGQGEKKHEKVLSGSSNDPAVYVVKNKMLLEGKNLGELVLCIDKTAINREIAVVSRDFETLIAENSKKTGSTLSAESSVVINSITSIIENVAQGNHAVVKQINTSIDESSHQVKSQTRIRLAIVGTLCCLVILALSFLLLQVLVIKPVKQISLGLEDIASGEGDLTQRIKISNKDELGELVHWFNAFIQRLNNIIVEIGSNSHTVTVASNELLTVSGQMADDASDLHSRPAQSPVPLKN